MEGSINVPLHCLSLPVAVFGERLYHVRAAEGMVVAIGHPGREAEEGSRRSPATCFPGFGSSRHRRDFFSSCSRAGDSEQDRLT